MANTTIANPDNIVVPLSAIVERLQNKISAADLNALLLSVVGQDKGRVLPGDLITADLFNQVLNDLAELNTRVAFLEGSVGKQGDVVITGLIPQDGIIKIGGILKVQGKNFQYAQGLLRAYVDRYPILGFSPESSDDLLVFRIPQSIVDVTSAGRPAILTVSNNSSSTQAILFLRPEINLAGFFELNEKDTRPSGAAPTGGLPYTMEFEIVSQVNLDTSVKVNGVVTGPANAADWQKNVLILNSDATVNAAGEFNIAQRERKAFLVRVDPVPQGTARGIAFSLEAQVEAGGVEAKRAVALTVGTPYATPDNTVTLNFASGEIKPTGAVGTVDASGVQIRSGSTAKIVFGATFEQAGRYDLSATVPTGWKWQFTDGTASPIEVAANEVGNGGNAAKNIHLAMWPDTNPAGVGELSLKLQGQGAAALRTTSIGVKLLP